MLQSFCETIIPLLLVGHILINLSYSSPINSFPIGDKRACFEQLGQKVDNFEVLPIYGWDNLRNVEAGVVIAVNYSKCELAADGKYLIPNDVYLIPEKRTKLHEFAELITHWHNYSSLTSKSINADGGLQFHGFGISGKYSNSYQSAKSKQVMDKSVVTRVQLRYIGYTAKLQPSAPLHPKFKEAVLKIGSYIQMNQTDEARYLSELLVRDYGTHIVTSIDAGVAIVQEDFVNKEFILKEEMNKHEVLEAASANFFGIVHFSISHKSSTTNKMADSYEKSKTSSDITTFGGSLYSFANYTVSDWVKNLDNNLVAMDRSGDPLYYLINSRVLPELPISITAQINDNVRKAIERYYEYNVYRGCMNMDSPNFSFQANVDDGTCKPPLSNLTFGGVFQICEMNPSSTAGDLCGTLSQPNPKTGGYSCPSNYHKIKLHTEKFRKSSYYRECHHCGWWSRCCSSGTRRSSAALSIFWCVANGKETLNSGYLFGGMFSSHTDNPLTKGKTCPLSYYPRMVGSDLKVCISDDYEVGSIDSLPFGGFFSCETGNPLADDGKKLTEDTPNLKKSPLITLKEYYKQKSSHGGPMACPKGFSQHLAIIDQDCSIYYCIVAGALSPKGLPPVHRPPFSQQPKVVPANEQMFVYNLNNETWLKDEKAMDRIKPANAPDPLAPPSESHGSATLSSGAASAITVCVTLACVGLVVGITYLLRRRKRTSETNETISQAPLVRDHADYGTSNNTSAGYNENC